MSGANGSGAPDRAFLDAALLSLALTAALTIPGGFALAGVRGVLGAAAALAFLAVLFGVSSLLHVIAAPHGRGAWLGLTLGGLALRVGLYVALIVTLGRLDALDGTAMGVAAAVGVVVGQTFEMRALVRARAGARRSGSPAAAAAAGGNGLEGAQR